MILGQSAPGSAADTDVYTVPQKQIATVRVLVAERGGNSATYRIAIRTLGVSIANKHYVAYDKALSANEVANTVPIEIGELDVVTVRASTADLSFTVTGVQEPELE